MKKGNFSRFHPKSQNHLNKSITRQSPNYSKMNFAYEKQNQSEQENSPWFSYIFFLLISLFSLIFVDKFQFPQQKLFFEISIDTPLAFKIENLGNEYLSPEFSRPIALGNVATQI